jgi:hypothetical protein
MGKRKNKTKLENGKKNKAHNIRRILHGVSQPPPVCYTDSTTTTAKIVTGNKRTTHTHLIMRNRSEFFIKLYSIIN